MLKKKSLSKRILQTLNETIGAPVIAIALWCLFKTYRLKPCHFLSGEPYEFYGPPARMICFWHQDQLLMPLTYMMEKARETVHEVKPISALSSPHRDGQLVADVLAHIGVERVAGSSSRGGMEAALKLVRLLRKGRHVAITPDGPRGPARVAKPGVVKIAKMAKAPIQPFAVRASSEWHFASWCTMRLPKPFAAVQFVVGHEVTAEEVSSSQGLELLQERLEATNRTALDLDQREPLKRS